MLKLIFTLSCQAVNVAAAHETSHSIVVGYQVGQMGSRTPTQLASCRHHRRRTNAAAEIFGIGAAAFVLFVAATFSSSGSFTSLWSMGMAREPSCVSRAYGNETHSILVYGSTADLQILANIAPIHSSVPLLQIGKYVLVWGGSVSDYLFSLTLTVLRDRTVVSVLDLDGGESAFVLPRADTRLPPQVDCVKARHTKNRFFFFLAVLIAVATCQMLKRIFFNSSRSRSRESQLAKLRLAKTRRREVIMQSYYADQRAEQAAPLEGEVPSFSSRLSA